MKNEQIKTNVFVCFFFIKDCCQESDDNFKGNGKVSNGSKFICYIYFCLEIKDTNDIECRDNRSIQF